MTLTRRALLAGTGVSGAAVAAAALHRIDPDGDIEFARDNVSRGRPTATFVSMPDFFNGDVADLSGLPTWDGGANSVNSSWETAIDKVLSVVAAHRPDAVLVAGDMVEGRWNVDSDDRRLFGPVSPGKDLRSIARCEDAVTAAGGVYFDYYRNLFDSRGLVLHGALGDHELLDDRAGSMNNRWPVSGRTEKHREPDNRYWLVDRCKDEWADHFTRRPDGTSRYASRPTGSLAEGTAYATAIGANLTLVTVDVFTKTRRGVEIGVFGAQLEWLRATIKAAKRRGHVVIVQGHVPITAPYRSWISGDLRVPEGRSSRLYQALAECRADFYFCGEVHDTTVRQDRLGAPVQVSHGCIFRYGFNFLVGRVYADGTTDLTYYEIPILTASRERGLWSTDASKRQRTELTYGNPIQRGRLVVRSGRIRERTRKLGVYRPGADPWAAQVLNHTVQY